MAEVAQNIAPTIEFLSDAGSTYKTYAGYTVNAVLPYRYTWEGDTIQLEVRVTDSNSLVDIKSVELLIDGIVRPAAVTAPADLTLTSGVYTLEYIVESRFVLYGDKSVVVRATDLNDLSNSTGVHSVWFNPRVGLGLDGNIVYPPGNPGRIVQAYEPLTSTIPTNRRFIKDDESEDTNWARSAQNLAEGNVILNLEISGTDLIGVNHGGVILVGNQQFFMNSTHGTLADEILTDTPVTVDPMMQPQEKNFFDFYLEYPAVPKDTYRGKIIFSHSIA